MSRFWSIVSAVILGSALLVGVASASPPSTVPIPRSVPEFSPASAGVVAVLLAGGAILIRRRNRR